MFDRFMQELRQQRWDDHRHYHHCRINQSLHFISALCFVVAYGLLWVNPAWSALLAWCVSMTTRQAGHFFFEPRGYDEVNQVTDEVKEAIKVGYNIRRKVFLMAAAAAAPLGVWMWMQFHQGIQPTAHIETYLSQVGWVWLLVGAVGLVVRVAQLWWQQNSLVAAVWATKIITDPFHDLVLYHKAPLALLRGERYDPMLHVVSH